MCWIGLDCNGMERNGTDLNEAEWNGTKPNGTEFNILKTGLSNYCLSGSFRGQPRRNLYSDVPKPCKTLEFAA